MKKTLLYSVALIVLLFLIGGCELGQNKEDVEKEGGGEAESASVNKGGSKEAEKREQVPKTEEGEKTEEVDKEVDKKEETKETEKMEEGEKTEEGGVTEKSEEEAESQAVEESEEGAFYQDIRETDVSKGVLMLCNKNYKLPTDFEPQTLAPVPDGYYIMDGKDYVLEAEVVEAFVRMADAAASEGLNLKVISGYRTADFQVELYKSYGETYGYDEADTYSARPRHSEHETGLCMDINMVDTAFEETAEYAWLMEHGAKYGFILRYPEGKEHITGYVYEPWHWRYVGAKAGEIKESGLTFDEYYGQFIE